jgi:multidrug efflux pump subunit AcrA (membrane-fusion protein)
MPEETAKSPSRRLLLLTGAAALVTAGTVAATGIVGRSEAKKQLVQWTDQAAIPTVRLARLDRGAAEQSLVLPGNIQPYYKAPIYARVSGYLKDWQADIGARVRSGQVLASIDTPDLDQQLLQAQANLATARANEQLTAITAGRWSSLAASQWVSRQANDEKAGAAAAARTTADAAEANVRQLEAMESFNASSPRSTGSSPNAISTSARL